MKPRKLVGSALLFVAPTLLLIAAACAGAAARRAALLPAMQTAWPGIARDIGPQHAKEVAKMTSALASGDTAEIALVDWPTLMVAAETGIAAAPVSAGVRESLLERVHQFDQAWRRMR